MKHLFWVFIAVFLVSCNDSDVSPYEEVLESPEFAAITDSIRKEPNRDDLYFRRAIQLNTANHTAPALEDFQKAWSLNKLEPYATGVGNILLEKKPDSAVRFLSQATRELPNSLFLKLTLARAYESLNKIDDALAVSQEMLDMDSTQINALVLRADLFEKKGDTTGMITTLEKAYSLIPSNRLISERLAYNYAETKNPKALSMADRLLRGDSLEQFADPFYIKGLYYANTRSYDKAIEQFDNTIRRDHRYLSAYIEKGKILLDQKKTDAALQTFRLANQITPSYPDAWYWIGQCLELKGQKQEAKLNYEKAYSLDKTFTEAREAAEKIK